MYTYRITYFTYTHPVVALTWVVFSSPTDRRGLARWFSPTTLPASVHRRDASRIVADEHRQRPVVTSYTCFDLSGENKRNIYQKIQIVKITQNGKTCTAVDGNSTSNAIAMEIWTFLRFHRVRGDRLLQRQNHGNT